MNRQALFAVATLSVGLAFTASCGAASEQAAQPSASFSTLSSPPDKCDDLITSALASPAPTAGGGDPLATLKAAQACPGYWKRECAQLTKELNELDAQASQVPVIRQIRGNMLAGLKNDACKRAEK